MTSTILSDPALSRTMQGGDMLQADGVGGNACGCTSLVGVANVYRRNLDARGIRFVDIFERAELHRLNSLPGRAPFGKLRDLVRKVQTDCTIDLDTNSYSVLGGLIGESVQVVVLAGRVVIRHVVAGHPVSLGRDNRVAGFEGPVRKEAIEIAPAALLRPLAEYEAVVGGVW